MLNFSSDIAALPDRLRLASREQQADAEILIAGVRLAIVLLYWLVYAAAPKAYPQMSRFEPVPLVLGTYVAITLSRLGLAYLRRLEGMLLGAFVMVGVVLLLVLICEFPHPIHAAAVLFAKGADAAIRVHFHRAPQAGRVSVIPP